MEKDRILAAAEAVIVASSGAIDSAGGKVGGSGSGAGAGGSTAGAGELSSAGLCAPVDVYEWAAKAIERFGVQYLQHHRKNGGGSSTAAADKPPATASPTRIPALASKYVKRTTEA